MAELLAPPIAIFRRRRTLDALALDPALELGAGGEARVLALPGDGTLVAKLYHHPTIERARKLALMMEDPPALDASSATLAWPADLLLDGRGRFAGFLMPRAEGPRVFEFYNPSTRRKTAPLAEYGLLHRAGANLAAAFDALHARGYVVGDVNESNVLVGEGGVVTLVDTDSFQVLDPEDGSVHRSGVGKPDFTPPELQGLHFADFDRCPEHDRFGLAVLLFLLLMEGTHPFAGRMRSGGEAAPVEERIRRGLFPHHGHEAILPPRMAPRFSLLHPGLRALFVRAFVDGHADPAARPAPAEWREALDAARERLVSCEHNPMHRHGSHLDACPWCERTALLGGRDPFPAHLAPVLPVQADDGAGDGKAAISLQGSIQGLIHLATGTHPAPAPAPAASASGAAPLAALTQATPPVPFVAALSTPLPWLFPLLWMVAFAPAVGWQAVSLAAFVHVVIRAFRRGVGPLTGSAAVAAAFLFLVAVLISLPAFTQPVPADEPYTREEAGPPLESAPSIVVTGLDRPRTSELVDFPPRLVNMVEVESILAGRYGPALRRGESGGLTLTFLVLPDGTADMSTIATANATDLEIGVAAMEAAKAMRFEPLTHLGERRTVWVALDLTVGR